MPDKNCRLEQGLLNVNVNNKMKIRELRQKPKSELDKLLKEKQGRLLNLRFDLSEGRVKNIREIKEIKKDIARISTLINQAL